MAIELTINGTAYDYPEVNDQEWGAEATAWASAVTTGMLQKAGGLFLLLAEVDFGTGYGLKSLYYKSRATNPAGAGILRLGNAEEIVWRNAANDDEFSLTVDATDTLVFDGVGISIGGDPVQTAITASDTSQIDLELDGSNDLTATLVAGGITNTEINASAGIAFSKLATLTSGNLLIGSAGNVPTSTAMSGDATIIASGAITIAANAVTNAKLAQMATLTIKGNSTGGTADPSDLSVTTVTSMLNAFVGDSGSGGTKGLVPAPASGDAAANRFLKADGTWTAPAGAGDVVGPASATDSGFAKFDGTTGKLLKNSAATIARSDVAAGTANHVLINNGSGAMSSEAQLALSRGGTNANLTAANGGIVYSTASALALTAAGTAGQIIKSNGASAPTWGNLAIGDTIGGATSTYIPYFGASGVLAQTWNLSYNGTAFRVSTSSDSDISNNIVAGGTNRTVHLNLYGTGTGSRLNNISSFNGATTHWMIGGHGASDGNLHFYTGSPLVDRVAISSSGRFNVGEGSPQDVDNQIHNSSTTKASLTVRNRDTSTSSDTTGALYVIKGSTTISTNQYFVTFFHSGGTFWGGIRSNGTTGPEFVVTSDRRIKENIKTLDGNLDKINAIRPVSFTMKDYKTEGAGFVAQELSEVFPEMVTKTDDGDGEALPEGVNPWTVGDGVRLIPYLVGAVKELSSMVAALKEEIKSLKEK